MVCHFGASIVIIHTSQFIGYLGLPIRDDREGPAEVRQQPTSLTSAAARTTSAHTSVFKPRADHAVVARKADAPGRSAGVGFESRADHSVVARAADAPGRSAGVGFESRADHAVVARTADAPGRSAGVGFEPCADHAVVARTADAPGRSAGVGFEPRADHAVVARAADAPGRSADARTTERKRAYLRIFLFLVV